MTTLLDEPTTIPSTTPAHRLRTSTAAARLSFTWFGVRKSLSTEQKAQAAESFGAEGDCLSAAKRLLDTKHPAFKAVATVKNRAVGYWKSLSLPYPEAGIRLIRQERTVACMAVLVAMTGQVQAGLITFTNRAAWEAAVGNFATENFNSIISDTFFTNSSLAFTDLVLGSSNGATPGILVDVAPFNFDPGSADIGGTPRVNLGGLNAPSIVTIDFITPVTAAGFDTVNYDINQDSAEAFLGATLIGVFPDFRGQTGFIGVLDTTSSFSSITIKKGNTNGSTFNAFDNVSFSSLSAVPEPSSLTLSTICAIAVCGYGWRRKRKQSQNI